MSNRQGYFVVVEGNERTGKTTQLPLLEAELKARGYEVVVTREPGGTVVAEALRDLVLDASDNKKLDPVTELLLFTAARHDHYLKVVKPALDAGKVVLCSRGFFSTFALQVHPYGDDGLMALFNHITSTSMGVLGDIRPFIVNLTLSEEERQKRFAERPVEDAIEGRGPDYQAKVAEAFGLLESQPGTITKDGALPAEQIAKETVEELVNWFADQDKRLEEAAALETQQQAMSEEEEEEQTSSSEEVVEDTPVDADAIKVELYTELDRHANNLQEMIPEEKRCALAIEWSEQIQLLRSWVDLHVTELSDKGIQHDRQTAATMVQRISDNMGALLGSWLTLRNIEDLVAHKTATA